jgi:hypothetical protein
VITLEPELVQGLDDPTKLRAALQAAVELEHATIPTYLYALYSLGAGGNQQIADLVRSVVLEEMTHMSFACNILNAIGGTPRIDHPGFLPTYPGRLPGSVEGQLTVPLNPFAKPLVKHVFMVIEEPEWDAPAGELTIGKFYAAVKAEIHKRDSIFTGKPARQVEIAIGDTTVTPITNWQEAVAAIELIVEQGEGTTRGPTDEESELAHYYRFAEIYYGHELVWSEPEPPPEGPSAYTGKPIPFEHDRVIPLVSNPSVNRYPDGSKAAQANLTFNYTYTSLLKTLHAAFNGHPHTVDTAIGLMESCKQQALAMGAFPVGAKFAGPSFEYQPTNP